MNRNDFSKQQQQAILDLLVLAMYADGHLASVEEARVKRWLTSMGFDTEFDRNHQFDASVPRVRDHAQTPLTAAAHAIDLAECFRTPEQRQRVHDTLEDLLKSDSSMAAPESAFLAALNEQFLQ